MVEWAQDLEEEARIPFGNRIIRRGVGWVVPVSFGGAFYFLVTAREVLAPIDALLEQCLAVGVALVVAGCVVLPVGMLRAAKEPRRLVDRETKEPFTLEFYDRYLIFTLRQWGIGFLLIGVLLSMLEPYPQVH
tara:strand:- start:17380 stop:17778 length:399 start_codon:yes stop_codon:yes gene_type:complete